MRFLPPEFFELMAEHPQLWGITSLVCSIFWIAMCVDCYRRRGLDGWMYFLFFFPPSSLIYFLAHFKFMFHGAGGRSLFGPSLSSRIRNAEKQLRMADTVAAHAELGELYYEASRFEDSENEFRKVLAFEATNIEALYYIGMSRLKRGEFKPALEHLKQVVDRDRKLRFGRAWLHYTECLVGLGRQTEALEERKKLSRAFPRPMMEFAYAELLKQSGQRDKAREVLEEMLATCDQAPSEDYVFVKRGRTLLREVA